MAPGWPGPLWEPPPMYAQITEFKYFEQMNFFFWGAQKNFFKPLKPYLALKVFVIVFKHFYSSYVLEILK